MQLFDPSVFKLNPNLSWELVDIGITKIIIIEDFYEDIKTVLKEIKKLPVARTYASDDDIADYRSTFITSIGGNEMPYVKDLDKKVREMISFTGNKVSTDCELLVNVTKLKTDRATREYHNLHIDSNHGAYPDLLSSVVFLNDTWHEGEGTSLFNSYDASRANGDWRTMESQPLLKFVQGKENRAIMFSPQLLHGATFGKQFMDEYRYTQAIFTSLT